MKKILFAITSLSLGGAERVLVDIVNKLQENYDITVFTIYSKGEMEKELKPNIKIQSLIDKKFEELNRFQKVLSSLRLLLFKKTIYNKNIKDNYDVEIAFLEGPITRLLSCKNKDVKKIAWIHNDISKVFGKGLKANIKKKTDKKAYEKYDKLVFVSNDNREKFEQIYNIDNEKNVIYNYINSETVIDKSNKPVEDVVFDSEMLKIVVVARLVKQKAIDRLVKIHSELISNGLIHNIYVIGDGPERSNIESMINKCNVRNTFFLLGAKENPYPYIKSADCLALLSHYEGYPMVLLEGQILEKFIIITDTAARETLINYNNKMIVGNNEEDIYSGLSKILKNKEEYIKTDYNIKKYDNSDIIEKIKNTIEQ